MTAGIHGEFCGVYVNTYMYDFMYSIIYIDYYAGVVYYLLPLCSILLHPNLFGWHDFLQSQMLHGNIYLQLFPLVHVAMFHLPFR